MASNRRSDHLDSGKPARGKVFWGDPELEHMIAQVVAQRIIAR